MKYFEITATEDAVKNGHAPEKFIIEAKTMKEALGRHAIVTASIIEVKKYRQERIFKRTTTKTRCTAAKI